MSLSRHLAAFSLCLCASVSAHAHNTFLLPSATVVSGTAPWITVDAGVATNVFEFDHMPLNLDQLRITAPDGTQVAAENVRSARLRSSFDLALSQTGTYRISLVSRSLSATYQENGKTKRWRGKQENLSSEIPASATELVITERNARIETIATKGKPGGLALTAVGAGLELGVLTHPNDLVVGETARFRLLLDGQAVAGVAVKMIPGGQRYRQQSNEQTVTTDADGNFSFTWKQAGMVWLNAEVSDNKQSLPQANRRVASYALTLEVLPE